MSSSSPQRDPEEFAEYLERLRKRAGYSTNVELAEAVRREGNPSFNASILSKWKTGATDPSIESLRFIAIVLDVPPIELFLRSGLVRRSDLGQREIHPIYEDLAELDNELSRSDVDELRVGELAYLRRHATLLLNDVRGKLEELTAAMRKNKRRRRAG